MAILYESTLQNFFLRKIIIVVTIIVNCYYFL